MEYNDISFKAEDEAICGAIISQNGNSPAKVLSLHGAGNSNRLRNKYLLEGLAKHGYPCLTFDFSGHGASSGQLSQSTLIKRKMEALTACSFFAENTPQIVIGSSMGAHTAVSLLDYFHPEMLILFCPAAYSADAENEPFHRNFSQLIRQPRSYMDSDSFRKISAFKGKLLIVIGTNDGVIPNEVVTSYYGNAVNAAHREVLSIDGADHQLHTWLEAHPPDAQRVFEKILSLL
jgi:uncharacterized protein